ncbi:hypothetical protein CVT26_013358 [Gymnopilus dilepis]|uniref:SMODS and SLOG-associating 2TM effector domain-containing protein n=1 Tax=Gymnopilus dilepis TaxID=231916 RepID=A0A409WVE9_9AGAR|nr:hypothetical protein CVT26_013358 [Gymnopilus dilepis]
MEYNSAAQNQPERRPSPSISPETRVEAPPQRATTPTPTSQAVPRPISTIEKEHVPTTPPRDTTGSPSSWPLTKENDVEVKTVGSDTNPSHPLPRLPEDITTRETLDLHPDPRTLPLHLNSRRPSTRQPSHVDWIVPQTYDRTVSIRPKSIGERLEPTLVTAISEKEKYAWKAKWTGIALNAAIGLQVVIGALTTGLSVVTTGKQTSIMTAVLGGFATIVASYLARARGSNEPELSITRVKDLEQFIRDCEAFKMDSGHVLDNSLDPKLFELRNRFEDLLGNGNG